MALRRFTREQMDFMVKHAGTMSAPAMARHALFAGVFTAEKIRGKAYRTGITLKRVGPKKRHGDAIVEKCRQLKIAGYNIHQIGKTLNIPPATASGYVYGQRRANI